MATPTSSKKLSPISGFPEYLPAQQRAFDAITARIRQAYESFGYTPLETAAVERTDILIAKGIDAKEVYGLRRLAAQQGEGDDDTTGAKELALRFDLTVPTARYVAQHYAQLVFPFRRHQIQPVWRGERPQKGRYRQFHQCDIDYIADGAGNLPLAADAEILACAFTALASLNLNFTMRVNNRKLLNAILTDYGINTVAHRQQAIKIIDDLEKLSRSEILTRLGSLTPDAAALVAALKGEQPLRNTTTIYDGLREVNEVLERAQELIGDLRGGQLVADYTIARGLDYYTGTVVETTLQDAPELGSICSGGRYENLAESLSERALPGVGISIGLSRLATWLMSQEPWASFGATPAEVYVAYGVPGAAQALRAAGLKVEEGLDDKPLGKQLMQAEKRGLTHAVTARNGDMFILRNFKTRQEAPYGADYILKLLQQR
ncbi:MAG: histidine--tRNA ligase [Alphaproteobacteria bacterium]|nr:histidine--tRNA ligase [Alphaproteobacteria bacterium]